VLQEDGDDEYSEDGERGEPIERDGARGQRRPVAQN